MNTHFKITSALMATIRRDLARPHAFAHERIGFISAGLSSTDTNLWVLARDYRALADEDYVDDATVGAMMSAEGLRKALQWAMKESTAIFHVHTHGGRGVPYFSGIDLREYAKFIPNFLPVAPRCPHGALVLSDNAAYGHIWFQKYKQPEVISNFTQVGSPLVTWKAL